MAQEGRDRSRTSVLQKADPIFGLLKLQLVLCSILILAALALKHSGSTWYESIKSEYEKYISGSEEVLVLAELIPEEGLSLGIDFDRLGLELVDFGEAKAVMTDLLDGVARTVEEKQLAMLYTGQGGWFPVKNERHENMTAPDGCIFSPIVVTAQPQMPVSGVVTCGFGYRYHPITETLDFHRGVDIAAPMGTVIFASLPGTVAEVGESAIYGNFIRIEHGNGLSTVYSHCESILAKTGTRLRQGERIALVGSTGISTGPHLHFEIIENGIYADPAWAVKGLDAV